ncbi:MAG: concanavalin A-like lectin/glucanase domain-containing protein [Olpidium bornovanus]|uniref:Concanavalin A-like lectin/glucanase domain-containing protein n=1 Tax=Olpidium bornovanus TaxID=278681 RepID=A0A8H7ZTF8_9FUNG|nr:MAG: concanavalin A-like lectin/glucanase domain-containing protein [Olpidium bornovanus]
MFVATYHNVLDPDNRLATLGPFMVTDGPKVRELETKVVRTLGVRPILEVETLRGPDVFTFRDGEHEYPSEIPIGGSVNYEIVATAKNVPEGGRVGFVIRHTADGSEQTVVYFDRARGRVVIDRSRSTKTEGVFVGEDTGKFELFQIANSCKCQPTRAERLDLRIFVDNSVVEVYANGRFALSSRIYPSDDADRLSTYGTDGARFDSIDVYHNIKSVFPDRLSGSANLTSLPLNELAQSSAASTFRTASVIALSAASAGTLVSAL